MVSTVPSQLKGFCLNPLLGLSVWRVHVHPVSACVIPSTVQKRCTLIDGFELNVSLCVCLSLCMNGPVQLSAGMGSIRTPVTLGRLEVAMEN